MALFFNNNGVSILFVLFMVAFCDLFALIFYFFIGVVVNLAFSLLSQAALPDYY